MRSRLSSRGPGASRVILRLPGDLNMEPQQSKPVPPPRRKLAGVGRSLAAGALMVCAAVLVVLVCSGAFLTYRIVTAHDGVENVSPASYLLSSYENVNFKDAHGAGHQGWLLLGLRGAPAIVLCHGYDSNRSALLSLGTVLQANHFNVYLFNFESSGGGSSVSNLGVHEVAVLSAALSTVRKIPGVDPSHVGVYGNSLGAYAALAVAERDPAVEALAVDNVYSRPADLFEVQVDKLVGGAGWLFRILSRAEFRLFNLGSSLPDLQSGLSRLGGKPKLFLASDSESALQKATRQLYQQAPYPKRLAVLPHTQSDVVSGPERKQYEDQVLNFFLHNLPLRSE